MKMVQIKMIRGYKVITTFKIISEVEIELKRRNLAIIFLRQIKRLSEEELIK